MSPPSRKRRSSPAAADAPELKKRKLSNSPSGSTKVAGPIMNSPEFVASDSSATLDEDTPPSDDKGKSVEKDLDLDLELDRLRKELAQQKERLEAHEKTLASVTQNLSCQVCLEFLDEPYALAPCGHVACHPCLVSWFTSPQNAHPEDEHNTHSTAEVVYSDNDSASTTSEEPDFDEDQPQRNSSQPTNGSTERPSPAVNDVTSAGRRRRYYYYNSTNLRKTCPHCRCIVRERPVLVYVLKSLVGAVKPPAVEGSNKVVRKKKQNKDPWKGIFRPTSNLDSAPGPSHPSHPSQPSGRESAVASGGHGGEGETGTRHGDGASYEPDNDLYIIPPPFVDHEDDVVRCGICFHEIWRGQCTNCGTSGYDSQGGSSLYDGGGYGSAINTEDDYDSEAENSEYEGSFIDDGERRSPGPFELLEDDFLPGPPRRLMRNNQQRPIVVSSGEEDGDSDSPGPATICRRRGQRRRVRDEEEEQLEYGSNSGDDDSNDVASPAVETVASQPVVVEVEDENYEGIPYAWDDPEDDNEDDAGGWYDEEGEDAGP